MKYRVGNYEPRRRHRCDKCQKGGFKTLAGLLKHARTHIRGWWN